MKDSEHLQWIYDRIICGYNESENVDFLIRLSDIIKTTKKNEDYLSENQTYYEKQLNISGVGMGNFED